MYHPLFILRVIIKNKGITLIMNKKIISTLTLDKDTKGSEGFTDLAKFLKGSMKSIHFRP